MAEVAEAAPPPARRRGRRTFLVRHEDSLRRRAEEFRRAFETRRGTRRGWLNAFLHAEFGELPAAALQTERGH
eukprot:3851244-Alexandrium_andersonii.AAC.1